MTTIVTVKVNGQYRATVTQGKKAPMIVEGNYNGGSGEASFHLSSPRETFEIVEQQVQDDDKRPLNQSLPSD